MARTFLTRAGTSSEPWYFTEGILYEFLRVSTHARVFPRPLIWREGIEFLQPFFEIQLPCPHGGGAPLGPAQRGLGGDHSPGGEPLLRRPDGRPDAGAWHPQDLYDRYGLPSVSWPRGDQPVTADAGFVERRRGRAEGGGAVGSASARESCGREVLQPVWCAVGACLPLRASTRTKTSPDRSFTPMPRGRAECTPPGRVPTPKPGIVSLAPRGSRTSRTRALARDLPGSSTV
jgi:hypothetical protein